MKTLPKTIGLASALALTALAPVEAQQARDDQRVEREEPRGSALARFAARALGADEQEAETAALLLPAVQALRAPAPREAAAEPAPSEEVSLNYEEVRAQTAAANGCPSNAHCDWINLNTPEPAESRSGLQVHKPIDKATPNASAGIEPDEIDARMSDARSGEKMQRATGATIETSQSGDDEALAGRCGGMYCRIGGIDGESAENAGIEPDEIDARATDEAAVGLLLPAVQKVREAASAGIEPDEIDARLTEEEPNGGKSKDSAKQVRVAVGDLNNDGVPNAGVEPDEIDAPAATAEGHPNWPDIDSVNARGANRGGTADINIGIGELADGETCGDEAASAEGQARWSRVRTDSDDAPTRTAANRNTCTNNLKQLGTAQH